MYLQMKVCLFSEMADLLVILLELLVELLTIHQQFLQADQVHYPKIPRYENQSPYLSKEGNHSFMEMRQHYFHGSSHRSSEINLLFLSLNEYLQQRIEALFLMVFEGQYLHSPKSDQTTFHPKKQSEKKELIYLLAGQKYDNAEELDEP